MLEMATLEVRAMETLEICSSLIYWVASRVNLLTTTCLSPSIALLSKLLSKLLLHSNRHHHSNRHRHNNNTNSLLSKHHPNSTINNLLLSNTSNLPSNSSTFMVNNLLLHNITAINNPNTAINLSTVSQDTASTINPTTTNMVILSQVILNLPMAILSKDTNNLLSNTIPMWIPCIRQLLL